ncbi:unnamed protein product [Rotaria sp. Silwood1]|nr:unnamed protein product [Rotaria sp. Silwood1]CAF1229645.1 unnamed protein product [Rotaria sp. Silwood1]
MITDNDDVLTLPNPSDSNLFIRAGTSGVRHLFPIHLNDLDYSDDLFCRSISHLRFHTSTTKLCANIEIIRNICSSVQTLEHLDISENELDDLPTEICLLNHLRTLNCSHNKLSTISNSFESLNQLKRLDLSFNNFKCLPTVIYTFKHLIRLNCECNIIKIIDIDLLNLKYLKILILDHNQIQTLDTIDFSQMKKLECFHIAHNQLIKFPRNLHKLTYLKNINLSHNRLTNFPIELLLINTLDVLNLSHNLFTQLPSLLGIYKRTSLMFSIDLSYNQLIKIYDYLLLISLKVDLSNNKIQIISNDLIRILNYDIITNRELKLNNNPLVQPIVLSEILHEEKKNSRNILEIIRSCFDEQQIHENIRQGFKIYITGCKKSGKSSLAYCLEEYRPLIDDEKEERIVNILQFPFHFETNNDYSSFDIKSQNHLLRKSMELPKIQQQQSQFDIDIQKQKRFSTILPSKQFTLTPPISPLPVESNLSLPLTIYDFNGSPEYYEYISPFIDTNALHLICIHTVDFDKKTPSNIEEIFHENFDITSYPIIKQLFQILQILCEKITKTNTIIILPIATYIDLYDKQSKQDKIQALDKINKFFQLYLQFRINRIKQEIEQINSYQTISTSLSDRLKTYTYILNINIQIESCQAISSLTCQGINELHQKIKDCILTQTSIFPHINRILPTLWAEANRYIESLADDLPVPYLKWENYTMHIINKYGLSDLIDDIAMSLSDQGKILILNEIGTTNRIVFLRPLWLGDLLSALFHHDNYSESTYQSYRKEYQQYGCLHMDLIHSLWMNLLHEKEYFYHVWNILMRFLLIAYPKINKKQLKKFINSEDKNDIKFDYFIVPYYLPMINLNEQEEEKKKFHKQIINKVNICYQSLMLPLGFFHRFSVLAILKSDVIYIKHWNNFIIGEHKENQVKFFIETNHHTYINFSCGTNLTEQPFDNIWNVLMSLLNLFEEMFKNLAPSLFNYDKFTQIPKIASILKVTLIFFIKDNQFNRYVCCPYCNEYSFMGEWITPKELQCIKRKLCTSCGQNVDTNYLIQPNEKKRRNEELLRKIRERKANNIKKTSNVISSSTTHTTHLFVPSV